MHACGTTLGANNEIGIALARDVLTVDEETGLAGAEALTADFFTGKLLINHDSEEEGSICTGCAGGVETIAELSFEPAAAPPDNIYYLIDINGLTRGHSETDIHRGRANSLKILAEFLQMLPDTAVCKHPSGSLINAIPRHATAVFGASHQNRLPPLKRWFSSGKTKQPPDGTVPIQPFLSPSCRNSNGKRKFPTGMPQTSSRPLPNVRVVSLP